MALILEFLANAAVIVLLAKLLPSIHIGDFKDALIVALVIAILNVTLGWILRGVANLFTLWLVRDIIRVAVLTVMVKLASNMMKRFEVTGWLPALIVAIGIVLSDHLVLRLYYD